MAICSKHTDPELRATANAMLSAAGYQVVDPLEETPFGSWADAQRFYQAQFQKWKLIFIGTALTTVFLAMVMLTLLPGRKLAQVGEVLILNVVNDTGRTAMARSVKAEGASLVAVGCYRWIPTGTTCQISLRKSASTGTVKIDFDGVNQVIRF